MDNNIPQKAEFKLPTLAEIYGDTGLSSLQKESALQVLLNQEPKKEWLKEHPTIKVKQVDKYFPLLYMPIQRVEWLLINVFMKYKVCVKSVQLIANSVVVTVRLKYWDHINNEWLYQDGVGSAPLQTDKGSGAVDFMALKSAAVQMSAPAAKSYAVKDAAEQIGRIFGKDLNRADVVSYESLKDKYKETKIMDGDE